MNPAIRSFGNSAMLVLASASPRRQELLRNAGIEFVVRPAHIPEERRPGEPPEDYVKRLAREKARTVWEALRRERPAALVLGADTTVVLNEHVLEKPQDEADAARMLRLLSGQTHQVMTGVCLYGDNIDDVRCECTQVTFAALSADEIRAYVATGEPMDKAGAYAIQGVASRWIGRIEGDYFNVVGLPVAMVYRMLNEPRRSVTSSPRRP